MAANGVLFEAFSVKVKSSDPVFVVVLNRYFCAHPDLLE
jgi:hypothetical protein